MAEPWPLSPSPPEGETDPDRRRFLKLLVLGSGSGLFVGGGLLAAFGAPGLLRRNPPPARWAMRTAGAPCERPLPPSGSLSGLVALPPGPLRLGSGRRFRLLLEATRDDGVAVDATEPGLASVVVAGAATGHLELEAWDLVAKAATEAQLTASVHDPTSDRPVQADLKVVVVPPADAASRFARAELWPRAPRRAGPWRLLVCAYDERGEAHDLTDRASFEVQPAEAGQIDAGRFVPARLGPVRLTATLATPLTWSEHVDVEVVELVGPGPTVFYPSRSLPADQIVLPPDWESMRTGGVSR